MNKFLCAMLLTCVVGLVDATDVGFTTTTVSTGEATAATPVVLTITRSPASGPLTVNYTTVDNVSPVGQQATIAADYAISPALTSAPTSSISFADGEASKTLTITVLPDALVEGREYIRLTLTGDPSYSIIGALSSVQVTIADNDLVATVINDLPLASESPNLVGSAYDPGDARRGLMRVAFSSDSAFDKTIQAAFTGTATFNTDYVLSYKIGGNRMADGFGFTVVAYAQGTTEIQVAGSTAALADNSAIRFSDSATTYNINAYSGGPGLITLKSALTHRLSLGASITIIGNPTITGYAVAKTFPIGTDTFVVTGGFGATPDLVVGDVFHLSAITPLPAGTPRYVVTQDLQTNGTLEFRRLTGGTTPNTGLDLAITSSTSVQTIFTSAVNPVLVLVPAESTRVEFAVTPGNTGNANDGLVEGAEFVAMALTANADYALGDPSTGAVTIADVDSTASIVLTSNAVEQDIPGTFTVSLNPPFTRAISVPYTISGTATSGIDFTALTGVVSVPAAGTGTITVQPLGTYIPPGGKTVILSLSESNDFVRADGVLAASTATMTILPTTGTVSLAATTNGTEGGTDAVFTVSLNRFLTHTEAVTVGYTVSGTSTAIAGNDYTALSGTVTIPGSSTNNSATITVPIIDDLIAEATEDLTLTLSTGSSYRLSTSISATVTIADNEPVISVSAPVNANEGGLPGSFTIGYPLPLRATAYPVTFVLSGSAVTPGDFTTSTPTTVTIPANTLSTTVTIAATDNSTAYTPAHQVILTISPPGTSGTFHVGTNTQTLSIIDNEPGARVSTISGATATEGGATAVFSISLTSPAPTGGLTIPYTLSGTSAGDFTANPDSHVVIAAGSSSATVTITATDNAVLNSARTLMLNLTTPVSPSMYSVLTASASLALGDNDTGVSSVTSSAANGTYQLSDSLAIQVVFTGAVTVTGTPTLTLATGTVQRQASYSTGSGTATLTFTYVVQANDSSSDLDYSATNSLAGTIAGASAPAVLTLPSPGAAGSLAASKALAIDGSLSGKPDPGITGAGSSGGGCGLGSGLAALVLCMLGGFALSIRRNRS